MNQSFHGFPSHSTTPTVTGAMKPSQFQNPAARPAVTPDELRYALAKISACASTYATASAPTKLIAYAGRAFFCISAIFSGVITPHPMSSDQILPNSGPYHRNPRTIAATADASIAK